MIPEDIREVPGERLVQQGASSLPVTESLEDTNNLDTASYFLYLLHEGKCVKSPPKREGVDRHNCVARCMFVRLPRLRESSIHYENCRGTACEEPHCKQSVALHEHWSNCGSQICFLCSSTVNLIIENFCHFLGGKGTKYLNVISRIKKASLGTRKSIIKSIVSIKDT